MENTQIKLSETVMVIDVAYLNFVINDLRKYFEPLLGRSLQTVDLALFTMYLAEVLPNFDRDRVYVSDIKKLISWYNLLVASDMTDFEETSETVAEEVKEETAE